MLLSQNLFPELEISQVKLFAGRPKKFLNNPDAPRRQETYFRALELHSQKRIRVYPYKYAKQDRPLPLSCFLALKYTVLVRVTSYQEKQADVDMAIHMVNDAARNRYDVAIVFTGDTDFVNALAMVRDEYHKTVYFVPTSRDGNRHISGRLKEAATDTRIVTEAMLANAQMPPEIPRQGKTPLRKPREWYGDS